MFTRTLVLALVAAALFPAAGYADHPAAGFGSGVSGPNITIPAHVLPKGTWAASVRLELIEFRTFSDEELETFALNGQEVHSTENVVSPSLSIAYGLSRTFTVSARMPYVARHGIREGHLEGTTPEVHNHGTSAGFGDVTLLGAFSVLERGASSLALLTGVKVPTGESHLNAEPGEEFEAEHQPGSGSWDFLEGAAYSRRVSFGSLDANLLATFPTEGTQATNQGTLFNYNVAVSAHMLGGAGHHHHDGTEKPRHHASKSPGADLILELNGEARARQKIAGEEDPNSGGNLLYLSPGVRIGPGSGWSASVSAGFPIVQDVNGIQHETDWRLLLGFGFTF